MNKLEKPTFLTTPIWANVGLVLGIIAIFSFGKNLSDKTLLVLIIILIIIFLLWNLIKYIINWHKFYKNYLNLVSDYNELLVRHSALSKQFDEKKIQIAELEKILKEYKFILDGIIHMLQLEAIHITNQEKIYLKELCAILLKDKEHLYNLEGGNKNV